MRPTTPFFILAAVFASGLSGCANFWDEVTSKQFSAHDYMFPPDPVMVLQTSKDGDARAKAMRRLEEPAQSGSPGKQDEVVQMLTQASLADPQPVCRMAAINALGRFKDPRAVPALINAFEAADRLDPDVAYLVRCQALNALGETKQAAAGEFLAEIARKPVKVEVTDRERGQIRDVKLAAVRSLRNFPNTPAAAQAAEQLAQNEKDIAVRDRARETYAKLTGREPASATPTTPPSSNEPPVVATVGHQQKN